MARVNSTSPASGTQWVNKAIKMRDFDVLFANILRYVSMREDVVTVKSEWICIGTCDKVLEMGSVSVLISNAWPVKWPPNGSVWPPFGHQGSNIKTEICKKGDLSNFWSA